MKNLTKKQLIEASRAAGVDAASTAGVIQLRSLYEETVQNTSLDASAGASAATPNAAEKTSASASAVPSNAAEKTSASETMTTANETSAASPFDVIADNPSTSGCSRISKVTSANATEQIVFDTTGELDLDAEEEKELLRLERWKWIVELKKELAEI